MPTMTKNLFRGQGERNHLLRVTDGHWPVDMTGSVFIIGPDKRSPGGHWFDQQGLIEKIHLVPETDGVVKVEHRRVDTPVSRIRQRLPFLFKKIHFMELSPFGVSNLANTNVEPIDGRLFIGYDAGRPLEVDPETLQYITPVGGNDEWFQGTPGLVEPLCAVAAHPGADHDEKTIYFVNYGQISPPGEASDTFIARWDLSGSVQRWKVSGMSPFDSIHDIKTTKNHLVFCDLPFQFEPAAMRGKPRTNRNQEHTTLWIVAKDDLNNTAPGGTVKAVEVLIPTPTGHLFVDYDEVDGCVRVILQHIPLTDLMIWMGENSICRTDGSKIDPEYAGLVSLATQPSLVGRYDIDAATGEVRSAETVVDDKRMWGGILATADNSTVSARSRRRQLWYASLGFDPDLITEDWWALYGEATDGQVHPSDLPSEPVPGSLARIDLESMKIAEVYSYPAGSFPSPPTFVPRVGAEDPDDGYVVVLVHRDGPKCIEVFDASHIEDGPLASASADTFNPNLMLHSCWMPNRVGPRPSRYSVGLTRDIIGAFKGLPGVLAAMFRMGKGMSQAKQK